MNRITIIQSIVDTIRAKSYLEIGVQFGASLFSNHAELKYGIDPKFQFDKKGFSNKQIFYHGANLYQMTSNEFFDAYAERELQYGVDVAFVDGLHIYNQALTDVRNCLKYLNEDGVIIMHDCNPLSYATAYPAKQSKDELNDLIMNGDIPGWNSSWNGDVWKALVHLRIENHALEIFTLDLDWGLGIITKGSCTKLEGVTVKEIEDADYYFLEQNRTQLLNLKPPKFIHDFLFRKQRTIGQSS